MRSFYRTVAIVTVATTGLTGLVGCQSLQSGISARVASSDERASRMSREVGKVEGVSQSSNAIQHDAGIWLGRSLPRISQAPLPAIFNLPAMFERSVNSLDEFAERITLRSGVPTKVAAEAANS